MTQYHQRFKTLSNQFPAWRQAISANNTLYYASASAPTAADGTVVWPGGTRPYGQNAEMGWWTMSGYSGGYFVPDHGAFGSLIIGTGGHDAMGTELLRYNPSQDSPGFDWWQQPTYSLTDTGNIDMYYSPAVMAGLDAAHNMNDGDWSSWVAAGKTYPCGYNGWIYTRPMQSEEVAAQTPKGFRFYCMAYIPPAMTGTGDGALIKARSNQGPWSQGGRPLNGSGVSIPVADWYDPAYVMAGGADFLTSISAKNTRTGEWSRLPVKDPTFARSASAYIPSFVHACEPKKRVYVWCDSASGSGFYYLDFTGGLAGVAVSPYIVPALGSAHAVDPYAGYNIISIDGRNLAFAATLNSSNSILWYDLDGAPNQFVVGPIAGLAHTNYADERWLWDAANRRILIVGHANIGAHPITLQTITVPSNISDASSYVASAKINLATAAGVSVQTASWMYGKVFLHPTLNCVFVPQDRHQMLAFVPG